jgi:ATP-dependent exoDNAse (exonuclease V) beta subunit
MEAGAERALTPEQESAVARRGQPLLVSAGAGSGKTSVLVERFVRGVCEDGLAPARILAITFTDRAAAELRERVRARLLALHRRDAARDTEAAFVCTFHGFCTRLLRSHPLLAGLDPQFQILDEALAADLRERAFALALRDFFAGERAAAIDLVAAYGADRVRAMLWRTFAELRSRGIRRPRLPDPAARDPDALGAGAGAETGAAASARADGDARRACALLDELLARFGERYDELKRARAGVDFDDLELEALALLEGQPRVRERWAERFSAVLVDEFQDTNPRQLRILAAIERDNLFTVGDELQSIYGFRDADVRLFRRRRDELEPRGASLRLSGNFRSRAVVLAAVNAAFGVRLGDRYMPLVAVGAPGAHNGSAAAPAGEPEVELLLTSREGWNGDGQTEETPSAYASAQVVRWREAEAQALAASVAELIGSGEARAGEVAVLLRALGDIDVYERALADRGVHTLASAGAFWRRQEVNDLVTYMRALANPLDELSLYGALAGPLASLSSDALASIARTAAAAAEPVWSVVADAGESESAAHLDPAEQQRLAAFAQWLSRERADAAQRGTSAVIERALQTHAYQRWLQSSGDVSRRLANVHKLQRLARRFEAAQGRDLRAFLDHVALQERSAGGGEADAPVAGAAPGAVRLMSVHAAKGLEFDVVCVADLGRALNLSVPDLLVEDDHVGLRLARLDGSEPEPALDYARLSEQRKLAQAEEEERILYVAMTRARERLLLSGAVSFERWPEQRLGAPPIAWLAPALVPELPELLRSAGAQAQEELDRSRSGGVLCRVNVPPPRAAGHNGTAERAPARPGGAAPSSARAGAQTQPGAAVPPSTPAAPAPAGDATPGREARREELSSERDAFAQVESLSYTALTEHRRCGYRFYLERVLGLEEAAAGEIARGALDARARGSIVHKLLEAVDFRRPVAPAATEAAAAAAQLGLTASPEECRRLAALAGVVTEQVLAARSADAVGAERPDATAAAAAGPQRSLGARLAQAERVQREYPFAFALATGQPLLSGVIDVLARERDGGLLVVDYKTDRVGELESTAQLAAREYDLQRLIYALAALRTGAPGVEVAHWFLERPRELVSVAYHARERGRLESLLGEQLRRARRAGFSVTEQPHRALCQTCPGRALLCSYDESQTMREAPRDGPFEQLELCAQRPV